MSYIKTDYKPFVDWMKETFRRLGEDCLVREICAINDERVDNLLRSGFMKGVMNAYGFTPTGGTNVFKEDNMNERMTRKELTAKVKDLSQEHSKLITKVYSMERRLVTIDERLSRKTVMLNEIIGLIVTHLGVFVVESQATPSKLVLKKVRKPYTRKK